MSHPGTEHWKVLGRMILYLKGKKTECIIIRKNKTLKAVMFCNSNYVTDKETRKSVSGIGTTFGKILMTCSSHTHRTIALSSTEADYMVLLACAQEVKFVTILFEEMTEVQKP